MLVIKKKKRYQNERFKINNKYTVQLKEHNNTAAIIILEVRNNHFMFEEK